MFQHSPPKAASEVKEQIISQNNKIPLIMWAAWKIPSKMQM